MKTLRTILLLSLVSITLSLNAKCFDEVGLFYKINPDYLRAIAYKESKYKYRAIGKNNDGSLDVGIMQINSNNFQWLKKSFPQISMKKLLNDPCFNIYVGGYILNENFKQYGRKWVAVGAYNAGGKNTPKRVKIRYQYALDVNHNYNAIKSGRLRLPSVKN